MNIQEIKYKNKDHNYSVIIGNNILNILNSKIRLTCPEVKKIALIVDKNVPKKFLKVIRKKLKLYNLSFIYLDASEKNKSVHKVNLLLNNLFSQNLNRSDLIIAIGGGITGDIAGFVASIFKRGINFINIPTTLLAQVDSAIGGKTGINSTFGKNLIGAFYQPKLVISDTSFLSSLPKKEMVCGYAEILKHAIIKDKKFFQWLDKNTKNILQKNKNYLAYAIKKSCEIKMYFVTKDVNEKKLRMSLNFGHTFAHAIEVKNKYSKKITHGEAVLAGMILASRLSVIKKVCKINALKRIEKIYMDNSLNYTFKKYSNHFFIKELIPYLKNDKKNNDDKINFILLKEIGITTRPNSFKISTRDLKKYSRVIAKY